MSPAQVVAALQSAISNALDNLPDVAADPTLSANTVVVACCADIAALSHLLAPDATGFANILAYL